MNKAEEWLLKIGTKDTLFYDGSWSKGCLSELMEVFSESQNKELIDLFREVNDWLYDCKIQQTEHDVKAGRGDFIRTKIEKLLKTEK